jgi:hypothetical protein
MGETDISRMASGDVQPGKAAHVLQAFIDVPSASGAPR